MRISDLDTTVVILQKVNQYDAVGNRTVDWRRYCACFANIEVKRGGEKYESASILPTEELVCTLRKCERVLKIRPECFRIRIKDKDYDITMVEPGARFNNYVKLTLKEVGNGTELGNTTDRAP